MMCLVMALILLPDCKHWHLLAGFIFRKLSFVILKTKKKSKQNLYKFCFDFFLVFNITKESFRNINPANRCQCLQSGSNINAITKHIIIFKYYFTKMYTNTK